MGFGFSRIERECCVTRRRRRAMRRQEATEMPRVILRRRRLPNGDVEITRLTPAFAG